MLDGVEYPPPLPPTSNIKLLRTEVSSLAPCCACLKGAGILTCSRCKAVKYCSLYCQKNGYREMEYVLAKMQGHEGAIKGRNGWKQHKDTCNNIKKLRKEAEAAVEELSAEFGGPKILLQTALVKKGRFPYGDKNDYREEMLHCLNSRQRYIVARTSLIEAYRMCGVETLSSTAFRLAAQNILDILCLTYSNSPSQQEQFKITFCKWMVAGGMDQLALNFLCYFKHRLISPHSLPYLDLSNEEDIEADSYLEMMLSSNNWCHSYILIALIKYKKLQALLVQRQKDKAIWRTFMMGTEPWAQSVIFQIGNMTPVIERIKFYAVDEKITSRIKNLDRQIKQILTAVNEEHGWMIQNIIDPGSISDEEQTEEENEIWGPVYNPSWTFNNHVHAWNMSASYVNVLKSFLRNGEVIDCSSGEEFSSPLEGFINAAFEVDPSRSCNEEDLDLFHRSSDILKKTNQMMK